MAYGYLESNYVKDGTVKDNLRHSSKEIMSAMARDAATGEYVDVVTVTKSGFRRLEKPEVMKLLES